MNGHTVASLAAVCVLTFLGLTVGMAVYWSLFDRQPPQHVLEMNIANAGSVSKSLVIETTLKTGERNCPLTINHFIMDGIIFRLPPRYIDTLSPGHDRKLISEIPLPALLADGEYVYVQEREFWCNPAQRAFNAPIRVMTKPIAFKVVRGDGS